MSKNKILVTGGDGLLGTELKKELKEADYPSVKEFDVTKYRQMDNYLKNKKPEAIFHAAAFTSPPKIDEDPIKALDTNIIGTASIVKLAMKYNIRLVYICTDYVFKGDVGNYKEDDPIYPVNKYAWSKLGGECAVRLYDNSLIIRTSFGPNVFPYEKAFSDQWTSRENVTTISKKIIKLLKSDLIGTIHIGGKRKSVYEYAKGLDKKKEIGKISIKDVNFIAPCDTSLNCNKFKKLLKKGL
jgi:dTDP-4-dehydrorhamnose reductase